MTLVQMIQNALQMVQGQLGIGLMTLIVIASAIYSALHGHWGWFWSALGGAGIVIGAAWFMTTVYGTGGGLTAG